MKQFSGSQDYEIFIFGPFCIKVDGGYQILKEVGYFRSVHYQIGLAYHRYDFILSESKYGEKISFWRYEAFFGSRLFDRLAYLLPYSLVFSEVL